MAHDLNNVMIIGHLDADPERCYTPARDAPRGGRGAASPGPDIGDEDIPF